MKKEELIKKAAERGITLDETQAEKYISLSDEELENLTVSGGCDEVNASDPNNYCSKGVFKTNFGYNLVNELNGTCKACDKVKYLYNNAYSLECLEKGWKALNAHGPIL